MSCLPILVLYYYYFHYYISFPCFMTHSVTFETRVFHQTYFLFWERFGYSVNWMSTVIKRSFWRFWRFRAWQLLEFWLDENVSTTAYQEVVNCDQSFVTFTAFTTGIIVTSFSLYKSFSTSAKAWYFLRYSASVLLKLSCNGIAISSKRAVICCWSISIVAGLLSLTFSDHP